MALEKRTRTDGIEEFLIKGVWCTLGAPPPGVEAKFPDDPPRENQAQIKRKSSENDPARRTGTDKRRRTLIYRAFWRHPQTPTLTASALAVWCYLWRLADAKTLCCWPPISRIARRTGISRYTIRRSIAQLKSAGFIIQKVGPCNLGRTNKSPVYMLSIPADK